MRTIGMIGGMSWESTATYYRIVNQETHRRLGGQHNAHSLVYTVDFADIEAHQAQGRWNEAGELLAGAARALAGAGAEILILCSNTMHKVAAAIVAAAPAAQFIHIADPTAEDIGRQGIATVALLGTRYTMEEEFYRGRLEGLGLSVLIPDAAERAALHRIIYEELCHGMVADASRAMCRNIVRSLERRGAGGVVLGCTEIGMILEQRDADVPLFDTTYLHALAAVRAALRPAP